MLFWNLTQRLTKQTWLAPGHWWGLERYEEALAAYDAVLELNADAATAYAGRARVKAQLERPMEAIADSTAALELDPDLSEIADLRSELQSQLALLPYAIVNFAANLRGGPGTNYPVIGQQFEGYRVKPIVRTADEQWIKLAQGARIHASLLNDVSLDPREDLNKSRLGGRSIL